MNIFKRISNLKYYIEIIKENSEELEERFNIRIDNIYRMYSVYSINPKEYEQYGGDDKILINKENNIENFLEKASASHMNTSLMNGDDLLNNKVDSELQRLENFLISKGLAEIYGLTQRKRLDKYNYQVVVEYKFLNTKTWANLLLIFGITILSSLIIGGTIASILLLL